MNLLVCESTKKAVSARKALELGQEWKALGAEDNMMGMRFEKILVILPLNIDPVKWNNTVLQVLRTRVVPGGALQVLN